MTDRAEQRSLREYTSRIRHLDATQAREVVALFHRPIPATGQTPAYDVHDPATAATCGFLSLERSPAEATAGIIGHYATHLYLHEVIRLPLSVARELVRHPLLSLDGVTLSLKGLRHVSPSGLAKLRQNPGIELPQCLRAEAAISASVAAPLPHPTRAEMIAAIERIARAGEEALSIR